MLALVGCFVPEGAHAPDDLCSLRFDREQLELWRTPERVAAAAEALEGQVDARHRRALRRLAAEPTRRRAVALLRAVLADKGLALTYTQRGARRVDPEALRMVAEADDPALARLARRKRDTTILHYRVEQRSGVERKSR